MLVQQRSVRVQFDGVSATRIAYPCRSGDHYVVGAVPRRDPIERVTDAGVGLFQTGEFALNVDAYPFGCAKINLNAVFHSALGMEGEEVEVVATIHGVGQVRLVAPRANRTLVHVAGCDQSSPAGFVRVPVDEAGVLEPTESVIA